MLTQTAIADGYLDWIAVDWGTTHLRAYALTSQQQVLAEAKSADGMGGLAADEFEPALLRLISEWLPEQGLNAVEQGQVPVLACGMVGARQGWKEAEYQIVPCSPQSRDGLTTVITNNKRIELQILPGLCQLNEADVMRGEETQIAGLLATKSNAFSCVCLPGTHSKWVQLNQGEITEFSTYMTGEMFALMSEHSILRHGVHSTEWDDAAFLAAVNHAVNSPQLLLNDLFRIRAKGLLEAMSANTARAHLSGLLIGSEIAGAKHYWQSQRVALIGEDELVALYVAALNHLGIDCEVFSPKAMTLAGLSNAYQALQGR